MTIHQPMTSFNGRAALDEDSLRRAAPSIFAVDAHESRSAKFVPVPTIEVLRALEKEGFVPFDARQSRTRDPGRKDFTKHMIRLRHADGQKIVNGTTFEVILKNGNDGTCRYTLMGGLFRFVCCNGMIRYAPGDVSEVKVGHIGKDVIDNVIEGTYRVLGESELALEAPEKWSQIDLKPEAQMAFAEAARTLRFGDAEGNVKTPITAQQLLAPRRSADTGRDLWSTFNRVQENTVKGGLSGIVPASRDEEGNFRRSRRVTTRAVEGIDGDIKLNRALWQLGERMAELAK